MTEHQPLIKQRKLALLNLKKLSKQSKPICTESEKKKTKALKKYVKNGIWTHALSDQYLKLAP
jgi:hypothetical protein